MLLLEFLVEFLAFFFAEKRRHRFELFDSFAQFLNLNLLAEIGLTEANTSQFLNEHGMYENSSYSDS